MKKLLALALPALVVLLGLPIIAAVMVTMSTQAAACDQQQETTTSPLGGPSDLGDLGVIDGPVGGPVNGKIGVASANIPTRSGPGGFRASMPKVLSTNPDLVTLSEQSARSLAFIESAAPGYSAYRAAPESGADAIESMGNVVLFKRDTWTLRNAGRVKIVDDDPAMFKGRPVTWDRHATWALLERKRDGAMVSIIAVHHMTNPLKFPRQHGTPPLTRRQQYGQGMDILLKLANSLATHGPVLIGGDMNSHSSYTDLSWSAVTKMSAAGYGWHNHSVDYVFFPRHRGVKLDRRWTGPMASDHQWVAARLNMNGAGPTDAPQPTTTTADKGVEKGAETTATAADTLSAAAPASDVQAALMRLRFADSYPTLTAEQARNAVTIARVARDLDVPRYGLEVAVAAAIQESQLVNLDYGDRDSLGLFQQRPSTGWGTREQITTPRLAAQAFFGRAEHTNNTGLLDIPGWDDMSLTEAAQAVQRSGYPDAYAQWETVAADIADLLGGDLPDLPEDAAATEENCQPESGSSGCPTTGSPAEQGLTPDALRVLRSIDAQFATHNYLGVGDRASNPDSDHPSGRAVDVMIENWQSQSGIDEGDRIADWVRAHAEDLGVSYVIWRAKIWSVGDKDWRSYSHPSGGSDPTLDHLDHVHVSVHGTQGNADCGAPAGEVVYPVPASLVGTDNHNWHETGPYWSKWHTGTDYSVPCGTPVYAAHAGTIEIDTTQKSWAGPWLVKVSIGPGSLTTWYAHMQKVTVSRGQTVTAGQKIGEVGQEGNVSGCHLHFEVHERNGSIYGSDNVDPSTWLAEHIQKAAA